MQQLFITLITIISLVSCKLSEQQTENLKSKYFKKMSLESLQELKKTQKKHKLHETIRYDPERIAAIIKFLNIPETYKYFDDHNATIRVKNQQSCGSCWSHASTTALAYRYFKVFGQDLDFSPQNGLSCYIRDCDSGNYAIDSAMHLIKNGTVTEGCFPFQSGDGKTMPDCPTTCEDGSEYKKYYAQDVFITDIMYDEKSFYDMITIILDQLYYHGPVVTSIEVYTDFYYWHYDKEKCRDGVYTYNGTANFEGGHSVAVVGYGKIDDKYYWLLQNSWGEDLCDGGFVKVEMGQIGVEQVAFIEPYLPDDSQKQKKDVVLKLNDFDTLCYMDITTTSNYTDWENTVEFSFKNKAYPNDRTYNMQCNMVQFHTYDQPYCFYEYFNSILLHQGKYELTNVKSLGTENNFLIDETFDNFNFYYYGTSYLETLFTPVFFVSQAGSNILLPYFYSYSIKSNIPPVYPNSNANSALSDCSLFEVPVFGYTFLNCKIKENELSLFEEMSTTSDDTVVFPMYCGYNVTTYASAYLLDNKNYPVFHVKQFEIPENKSVSANTPLYLVSEIKGSVDKFKNENYFYGFIDLELDGVNLTVFSACTTGKPTKVVSDYNLECYLLIADNQTVEMDNLYLRDVYSPYMIQDPYDIIIPGVIKGTPYSDHGNNSQIVKLSMFIILSLILLL